MLKAKAVAIDFELTEEKNAELLEQEELMDKCNYLYGQKQEMLYEGSYKKDMDHIQNDEERQKIVRRYVNKVLLEKTGEKRGHYNIEVIMANGKVYKYSFWSSGPWNHVEKI